MFKLDDIIIDRIQMGVATDFDDNPLYTLTQLSDATIDVTAESVDATDRDGVLIKRFWRGKTGTFTATNAMLNTNLVGAMSGQGRAEATASNSITMPAIKIVKGTETTVVLNTTGSTADLNTVKIVGMANNGAMSSASYTVDATTADASHFKVESNTGTVTLPVGSGEDQFVITYQRTVTSGYAVVNRSDKYPQTVRLLLKVLYVDPCSADTLRAGYVYLPSFQVSPELSISLTTDGTLDYSGDLQTDGQLQAIVRHSW